jgi:heme A synthase
MAAMAVWLTPKPPFRPLQRVSAIVVLLLLVQTLLGFVALGTGSQGFALLHFLVALAMFGATISGASVAMRWDSRQKSAEPT